MEDVLPPRGPERVRMLILGGSFSQQQRAREILLRFANYTVSEKTEDLILTRKEGLANENGPAFLAFVMVKERNPLYSLEQPMSLLTPCLSHPCPGPPRTTGQVQPEFHCLAMYLLEEVTFSMPIKTLTSPIPTHTRGHTTLLASLG
jgi:hypothetical protein